MGKGQRTNSGIRKDLGHLKHLIVMGQDWEEPLLYVFEGVMECHQKYKQHTNINLGYFLCYLVDYNSVKTRLYIELQYI